MKVRKGGTVDPAQQGEIARDHETISPIALYVPMPPSVNRIWRRGTNGNMHRSAEYRDWLGHAGWVLRSQRPRRVAGRVVILVAIERVDKRADIDNRVKALFDLLQQEKIIRDDKLIVGFAASWAPAASGLARLLIIPAADVSVAFKLASDGATGGWFIGANEDLDDGTVFEIGS